MGRNANLKRQRRTASYLAAKKLFGSRAGRGPKDWLTPAADLLRSAMRRLGRGGGA